MTRVPLRDSNGRELRDENGKPLMCEQVASDEAATQDAPDGEEPASENAEGERGGVG
jgi:hypothetical protein